MFHFLGQSGVNVCDYSYSMHLSRPVQSDNYVGGSMYVCVVLLFWPYVICFQTKHLEVITCLQFRRYY